jgi:hypothetical protein
MNIRVRFEDGKFLEWACDDGDPGMGECSDFTHDESTLPEWAARKLALAIVMLPMETTTHAYWNLELKKPHGMAIWTHGNRVSYWLRKDETDEK